jgi:23S rRNA (pseudouridine1915-N3)-methyltransferase
VRIRIVAVGHRQPDWVQVAFDEYSKRMPPEVRVELVAIKPDARPVSLGPAGLEKLLEREAQRISAALPPGVIRVVLDERGQVVSSRDLSVLLERWLAAGADVGIVIGSADGLHPRVKVQADVTISLSAMTLPHGLVRVVVAEQLYRAVSLLRGHPYHRE